MPSSWVGPKEKILPTTMTARSATGHNIHFIGKLETDLEIRGKKLRIIFYITDHISRDYTIIGREWIQENFKQFSDIVKIDKERTKDRVNEVQNKNDEYQSYKETSELREIDVSFKGKYKGVFQTKIVKDSCYKILMHTIKIKDRGKRSTDLILSYITERKKYKRKLKNF